MVQLVINEWGMSDRQYAMEVSRGLKQAEGKRHREKQPTAIYMIKFFYVAIVIIMWNL